MGAFTLAQIIIYWTLNPFSPEILPANKYAQTCRVEWVLQNQTPSPLMPQKITLETHESKEFCESVGSKTFAPLGVIDGVPTSKEKIFPQKHSKTEINASTVVDEKKILEALKKLNEGKVKKLDKNKVLKELANYPIERTLLYASDKVTISVESIRALLSLDLNQESIRTRLDNALGVLGKSSNALTEQEKNAFRNVIIKQQNIIWEQPLNLEFGD